MRRLHTRGAFSFACFKMDTAEHKSPRVGDLIRLMDDWAPAWYAESWDKVGLLVGDPNSKAEKVLTALDFTPRLVDYALESGVDALFLHHPPIFKSLAKLRMDDPATASLVKAAADGISLFAAHTNLDAAIGGVNDALAARLGMVRTSPMQPLDRGLAKLVFFIPPADAARVKEALFAAGAGRIGDYTGCSFTLQGRGEFTAPEHGRPYLGRAGESETVAEERVELVVPLAASGRVIRALYEAHPYEEPAFDLYPLQQGPAGVGLGRVGALAEPLSGAEFIERACKALGADGLRWAGILPDRVERVACLGGSGGDMAALAAARGAQVYVTGEAKYNQGHEARDLGICLVSLGHFQTEEVVVKPWAQKLGQMARAAGFFCNISPYNAGKDPWRSYGA